MQYTMSLTSYIILKHNMYSTANNLLQPYIVVKHVFYIHVADAFQIHQIKEYTIKIKLTLLTRNLFLK